MALTPGTRLGPYEVTALIGAGGMGEVYKATDTNLKRGVAIKVLPASVVADAERLARFQREAEVLAALNHPHIAAIYGLERSGGITALVMELVEGEDLSQRIARGAIPLEEALPIAKQIAEALEAAHEQGIIHRDLKPANIKVRPDGTVKVLDFGLAKILETGNASASIEATHSPTLSVAATHAGVILGTAAYMAPEQAKGRFVDKRSDVWAFGCVLYEMLTGRRAFDGEDLTEIIGAVVRLEPSWTVLPTECPAAIRTLLRRCLEKDARKRITDISTALFVLQEAKALTGPATSVPEGGRDVRRHGWPRLMPYAAAIVVTTAAALPAGWFLARPEPSAALELMRFRIDLPPNVRLYPNGRQPIAISRDGRRIAFSGVEGNLSRAYVRSMDQLEPVALEGTERTSSVYLSPDGEWVGYNLGRTLRKVPFEGGPSATIFEVPAAAGGAAAFRGISWGSAGRIAFAASDAPGLMHVSEAGGTPEPLTSPPEGEIHRDPHFLPDGRTVLFVIERSKQPNRIAVVSLDGGEPQVLLAGDDPRFAPSGHLLFLRDSAVWAIGFHAERLRIGETPVPVLEDVDTVAGAAHYVIGGSGALVYSGGTAQSRRTLVWVDRQGVEEAIPTPPRAYWSTRLSPDGSRVALDVRDEDNDIWIWDLRSRTLTRTTFDRAQDETPVWTPDGRQIAFRSNRNGPWNLFRRAADGTGGEELLTKTAVTAPTAFSPDGTRLVLWAGSDIATLDLTGSRDVTPLFLTPFPEFYADVSPDGRWIAYQSQESVVDQIFVRPFPDVQSGRWQVSTDGGRHPVWSRNGRELFYVDLEGRLTSVAVDATSGFRAETPRRVLERSYFEPIGVRAYDVSSDGKRFLMIKEASSPEGARAQVVVVLNFTEELKRRVPVN